MKDEIKEKNSSFRFKHEINIDLNDLFTLDFKNLKIFLTTILQNQNEMSDKIEELEKKLKEQDSKNQSNYTLIENRIKIIEKNNLEKENKKEEEEDEKYLESDIKSLRNQDKEIESKSKDKDEKNKKKDDINIKNENDEKFLFKRRHQKRKTIKEQLEEEFQNTIPEEESVKNDSESEKNEDRGEQIKKKFSSNYDDLYRAIPIRRDSTYDKIDDLINNYNSINIKIEDFKKKLDVFEKKNKSLERDSYLYSFKSLEQKSNEELQYLKIKIRDLQDKNEIYDKENESIKKDLEDIKVKVKDFDIYEIFREIKLDEGSIDAAKALVLILEQKVFKKTELIDDKIKRIENEVNKIEVENKSTKNIAEILKLSSEDIKRMIKNLEELENKNAEETLGILNDINDFKNEYKKNNINIDQKLNDLNNEKSKMIDKMNKKLSNLEKKYNELDDCLSKFQESQKSEEIASATLFKKLKHEFNEVVKELKRKDSDLEKEIEKLKANPEFVRVQEKVAKIEKELSLKTDSKDFLDLKEKMSVQNSNLSNLRDNLDRVADIANKGKNDIAFVLKRLETLSAAQVSTRTVLDELIGKQQEFVFDSSKYLEISSFNKLLTSIQKEKDKQEQNFKDIHKLLKDMSEVMKTKSSSEDMKVYEEIINNKLEELKIYSIRRFADKIENNRNIKFLDSQIRHIIDVYIKKMSKPESWLIAKKPLGGFSCASCESYLGELKKYQEYKPWNKYPNRDKEGSFKLGSGFSKMLNMLNADFKKEIDNIKDNNCESDNERLETKEYNLSKKRLSKNLSSININNNSCMNIKTRNDLGNKNMLPKISFIKGEDNKDYNANLTMDVDNGGIGAINDLVNQPYESETKNNENNEEQPHVVKVYRKNKLNISDIQKKNDKK